MSANYMILADADEQAEAYALVVKVYMPNGICEIAADDVVYNADRACYAATHDNVVVAMWPEDITYIAIVQSAFKRKSYAQLIEERVETQQEINMLRSQYGKVLDPNFNTRGPEQEPPKKEWD